MSKDITNLTKEDLDNINIWQLIPDVNRHFSNFIDKKLFEYDITRSQAHFLLVLNEKDHISQEELCNRLNMTEGTVARTIKRLEDKKFLVRSLNPNDKRKKVIVLTQEGKETISKINKNNDIMKSRFESIFSDKEIDNFKLNLIKILNLIRE